MGITRSAAGRREQRLPEQHWQANVQNGNSHRDCHCHRQCHGNSPLRAAYRRRPSKVHHIQVIIQVTKWSHRYRLHPAFEAGPLRYLGCYRTFTRKEVRQAGPLIWVESQLGGGLPGHGSELHGEDIFGWLGTGPFAMAVHCAAKGSKDSAETAGCQEASGGSCDCCFVLSIL